LRRRDDTYNDWLFEHSYLVVPAQAGVAQLFSTFTEFPPAQRPASFSIDQIQEQLEQQLSSVGGGQ
jgi:arylsulfatase